MLDTDAAIILIDRLLKDVGTRQDAGRLAFAEVQIDSSSQATSRFANSHMTQNQAQDATTVSLHLAGRESECRLSTQDISTGGLARLVDDAYAALMLLPAAKDPPAETAEPSDLIDSGQILDESRYDPACAALDASERGKAIKRMIQKADGNDQPEAIHLAGILANGQRLVAFGNSRGVRRVYRETFIESSLTGVIRNCDGSNATGWAKGHQTSMRDLDLDALTDRALAITARARNPREIAPGKYRVLLEAEAVLDLLGFIWWDFAATSHLDRLSPLAGKIGEQIFGSNVSLRDDVFHPLQSGPRFDGSGYDRKTVDLVKDGVLTGLVTGSRSSRRLSALSPDIQLTGHGLPEPSAMGEIPANPVFLPSDPRSMTIAIDDSVPTIVLNRVWYVREVDPSRKLLTGMTRDGIFMGGQEPLKNMRFNISLMDMLQSKSIVAMGPARRAAGEETFPAIVPSMIVDDFNFTETTKF
jgi:predicted Zn-dependent protease